ncbi:competence damage-inducible protein A [Kitasatospora herbaricolor]|uniref:CinA family protein n=1 Tax=Kitasatospora herbaricolor TaxID=68217 RepID=UPI00198CAEA8|nr:CinA family protein [Kitasatospora herbaricolor]MDQ0305942.1 nicotinamide-nucleotide amidase [Kitasatospora herbaricolor]GGV49961.1 competence damage-inducible protein A [Kitasatospora herbaricolor]
MSEHLTHSALLARQLHAALDAAGSTLAVAESLTGGRLAVALAEAPGASSVFKGSVTAYATDVKAQVLHVASDLLDSRGPVDGEVAQQMAQGVRTLMRATYALATTGVAGPASQAGHPPGTVHVALAGPHGSTSVELGVHGDREAVQHAAVIGALQLLHDHIRPSESPGRTW